MFGVTLVREAAHRRALDLAARAAVPPAGLGDALVKLCVHAGQDAGPDLAAVQELSPVGVLSLLEVRPLQFLP